MKNNKIIIKTKSKSYPIYFGEKNIKKNGKNNKRKFTWYKKHMYYQ